jgi:nucleotide-binding universal stress UspA family protein
MSAKSNQIEEKIKKFEQAIVPEKTAFVLPRIKSILLALDAHDWVIDSSRYSYKVACELSIRYNAYVHIICMAINNEEYHESEKLVEEAIDYFDNRDVKSQGSCTIGSPSNTILKISKNEQTDLIILPSPYAERVEKDNLDSLGATIEILNNRSTVPLLLLTESDINPEKITDRLLVPVQGKEDILISEWALLLSNIETNINVLDTVNTDSVEEIKDVSMDLLDEDVNEGLIEISLRKNTAPLLNVLKEIASEMKLRLIISNRVGDFVAIIIGELNKKQTSLLIVDSKTSKEKGSIIIKESKKNKVPLLIIK